MKDRVVRVDKIFFTSCSISLNSCSGDTVTNQNVSFLNRHEYILTIHFIFIISNLLYIKLHTANVGIEILLAIF